MRYLILGFAAVLIFTFSGCANYQNRLKGGAWDLPIKNKPPQVKCLAFIPPRVTKGQEVEIVVSVTDPNGAYDIACVWVDQNLGPDITYGYDAIYKGYWYDEDFSEGYCATYIPRKFICYPVLDETGMRTSIWKTTWVVPKVEDLRFAKVYFRAYAADTNGVVTEDEIIESLICELMK